MRRPKLYGSPIRHRREFAEEADKSLCIIDGSLALSYTGNSALSAVFVFQFNGMCFGHIKNEEPPWDF